MQRDNMVSVENGDDNTLSMRFRSQGLPIRVSEEAARGWMADPTLQQWAALSRSGHVKIANYDFNVASIDIVLKENNVQIATISGEQLARLFLMLPRLFTNHEE